ncbi:MAG: energy coupling factor transporter S component ThiW, partial [Blautia hydrogenotrophica]
TGICGALASYPLMKWFYGLDLQNWYYYIPFYTPAAVVGGAMGVAVLLLLRRSGVFRRMLSELNGGNDHV